jgi:4-aminobutyrate aminotransferase/(S)-3-amino-2-methylpropionate transaminase
MMCGSCSVENALKVAFAWYQAKNRGRPVTDLDLSSCMMNKAPGSADLSVMSFKGGFHGRLLGCLSATRSKPVHKLDFPAFDWPAAPFPSLRYPLAEHEQHNAEEERRCLAEVDRLFTEWKVIRPVAALVVEPIQAEGGDNHASAAFFKGLQALCKEHGAAFVVDEVQTGGGNAGRMWQHEAWGLSSPPDLVTFSKKMLTGGFFYADHMRPTQAYRIFNTWMGDPVKIVQLEAVLDTIKQDNLLEGVNVTGEYIMQNMERLAKEYPGVLANPRGTGTLIAIDVKDAATRDKIVYDLRQKGIEIGGCGTSAIRLRPSLVFQPKHAEIFLNKLEEVVKTIA